MIVLTTISKYPAACIGYSFGAFIAGVVLGLFGPVIAAIGCVMVGSLVIFALVSGKKRASS